MTRRMTLDIAVSNIKHPGGFLTSARFLFRGDTAAAYTATANGIIRNLYATEAIITEPARNRDPYIITLASGEEWAVSVKHKSGGCGCKKKPGTLAAYSMDELLDPEWTP